MSGDDRIVLGFLAALGVMGLLWLIVQPDQPDVCANLLGAERRTCERGRFYP